MVERRRGHRRHAVDPAEHVVVGRREAGDLERRRDEDRAVQADARRLLEHAREPSDAVAAVALARDEDRRAPAAVLGEPAAHELAQRLEVALVAEVLLRVGRVSSGLRRRPCRRAFFSGSITRLKPVPTGSTNTRSEKREPRRLVLDEARRHRRQRPVRREVDALRADGAHVQVRRRSARAAVEDERDRAIPGRPSAATYETEKISAAGFSFLRRTVHFPVAVYWIALRPRPHVPVVSAPAGGSWSGFFPFSWRSSSRRSWARRLPVVLRSRMRRIPDAQLAGDDEAPVERGGEAMSQVAVETPERRARAGPDGGPRIGVLRADGRALGRVRDAARRVAGDARRRLRLAARAPDRVGDPDVDRSRCRGRSRTSCTRRSWEHWLRVAVVALIVTRAPEHLRPSATASERACNSAGPPTAERRPVPRPHRRRARPGVEPLALARQVAPRDPALHRARVPLAHALRADGRRVLRDPLHRPLPARRSSTSTSACCAGRGGSPSTRTARSAPTATRRSRSTTSPTTRRGSTSRIPERLSRGLVLVKWWLLAIPHYVVVGIFLGGGGYAASRVGRPGRGASASRPA